MNYGEAKAHLLKGRKPDATHEEQDEYFDNRERAMNIILLSFAENAERTATALTRIANALEKDA